MENKICSKCGINQPLSNYHKNGFDRQGNQKYRGYCKTCANKIETERYHQKKDAIDSLKDCCIKCGESRLYVLDFHHINKDEKETTIGKMKRGLKALQRETEKCVCLCANCHRKFHFLERQQKITIEDYLS